MDPIETLQDIEQRYRRVLDLTREQAACLARGDEQRLVAVLAEKSAAMSAAQELMGRLPADPAVRGQPAFQERLGAVAAVLRQVMEAEQRCQPPKPAPQTSAPPRSRVLAAYGAGKTGRK